MSKEFKIVLTKFSEKKLNPFVKNHKFKCIGFGMGATGRTIPEAWKNYCRVNGIEIDEKGKVLYEHNPVRIYRHVDPLLKFAKGD